jgi:hypothetical protein
MSPSTSYGGGCLLSGTLVTLANREKIAIEDIEQGQKVLSYADGNLVESSVQVLFTASQPGYYELTIGKTRLKATAEHPILTAQGWKKVSDLELGDKIIVVQSDEEQIAELVSKEYVPETVEVYNLMVDGPHTYIANNVVVHNKPSNWGGAVTMTIGTNSMNEPSRMSGWILDAFSLIWDPQMPDIVWPDTVWPAAGSGQGSSLGFWIPRIP